MEPREVTPTREEPPHEVDEIISAQPQVEPMRTLTYFERETGNRILVGSWSSRDIGDERRLRFKPKNPISHDGSPIFVWLGNEIVKYGRGTVSKEGIITVYILKGVKYGRLISEISWFFYTML